MASIRCTSGTGRRACDDRSPTIRSGCSRVSSPTTVSVCSSGRTRPAARPAGGTPSRSPVATRCRSSPGCRPAGTRVSHRCRGSWPPLSATPTASRCTSRPTASRRRRSGAAPSTSASGARISGVGGWAGSRPTDRCSRSSTPSTATACTRRFESSILGPVRRSPNRSTRAWRCSRRAGPLCRATNGSSSPMSARERSVPRSGTSRAACGPTSISASPVRWKPWIGGPMPPRSSSRTTTRAVTASTDTSSRRAR